MDDNPLDDSNPEYQERIRNRAYHLWEADGCPDGHDQEYWERAEDLIGMETNPQAGTLPNPMTTGEDPGGVVVEEASIQDNLGEFPGRFTDQGETRQTPMASMPAEAPVEQPPRHETARTNAPAGKAKKSKSRSKA